MITEWLFLRFTPPTPQRTVFAKMALETMANVLYKKTVNIDSIAFGPLSASAHLDSVSTDTIVVLASSFAYFERYTQAEALYQHCMARFHGHQNSPEPQTETQLFELYDALGFCYMNKVDYPSSESFYTKAVGLKTSILGPDHPLTLNSMHDVGTVYRGLQKYNESSEMLEHVQTKMKDVHGPESNAYLNTANNLALVYRWLSRAPPRGNGARPKDPGEQCLGSIYRDLGDDSSAERLYSSALSTQEKLLGIMHASTLRTASQLEKLYRRQGKTEDADKIWDKIQGILGMAILQAPQYGTDD
ncbi:uncharacterized protein N7483_011632 [Penicillium malachiteum]|uniref:uncharacterized protein n=1 Tax=Penicillium malachiteum TaxID=1324776 RepID=UPI002548AE4A|nr:uncharacterized protein N7483_011632 [Penicillium malachiteum]KAJ5714451.1 hypothetical protein N7483_011632 [Penicillium malachiteum]